MSTSSDPSGGGSASQGRKTKMRAGLDTIGEVGDTTGHDSPEPISGSALATPSSRNSGDWLLPPIGGADSSRHSSPLASPALHPLQPSASSRISEPENLRLALHKALLTAQAEQHDQRRQAQLPVGAGAGADAEESPPLTPKALEPVLKRNTTYSCLRDFEDAEGARGKATDRQARAMQQQQSPQPRTGRPTVRLQAPDATQSAPGSRTSSVDRFSGSYFQSKPGSSSANGGGGGVFADDDDEAESPDDLPEIKAPVRHRPPYAREISQEDVEQQPQQQQAQQQQQHQHGQHLEPPPTKYRYSEADQNAAKAIVESYNRANASSFFCTPGLDSEPAAPTLMDEYAQDYVPPPTKFRGGILGHMMKLFKESGSSDMDSRHMRSGFSTPTTTAPGTPLASPMASPAGSRATSPTRGSPPTPRPVHRLKGIRKSASSATLTELLKTSSSTAAQRSGELSDQLIGKFKKKVSASRNKDKMRITVHIAAVLARHRYLIKLCRALMMYGAPTHRLEEYMTMSARVLEIDCQFLYIPGCMFISFDDSTTHTTEVKLVRVPHGIDLGRMRDVHEVYKRVVHDRICAEEATGRLDNIMGRKPKFNRWFRVLMYGIASACVAPFAFQGRFIDMPIAFILGCIVGALQLFCAPSNDLYAHVFEVTAAVITSFAARGFGSIGKGRLFCFSALAQSSIALILPGYMVLCASLELQSNNMVSGGVRMVHALVYTLFLGYGITIGASLYGMFDENAVSATTCTRPLDSNWNLIFVPAFTLCLCMINQAKWAQMPVMLAISLLGFIANSYTSRYFVDSPQISNMLGALAVGILANLYSRLGTYPDFLWYKLWYWWRSSGLRDRLRQVLDATFRCGRRPAAAQSVDDDVDLESNASTIGEEKKFEMAAQRQRQRLRDFRKFGYNLAAAAMLPAIFVQVPSGLAASGSLLAGVNSANQINSNHTGHHIPTTNAHMLDGSPFSVLFSVIQVAISLSVGLFLSHLLVYPLGKRRSGLFSF